MNERLFAISPLDGRYREKVDKLSAYFSEYALMQARVEVELRYLIALSDAGVIRKLTTKEKKLLQALHESFSAADANTIKEIELTTRHDVKAAEYWIKERLRKTSVSDVVEFVHFGLTSTDIDNIAYALLTDRAIKKIMLPAASDLIRFVVGIAEQEKKTFMLARTHGQPAVTTTLGKEFAVHAVRLTEQCRQLASYRSKAKLNGAVGNYNALALAVPDVDWISFSQNFISGLGLEPNLFTTQIEPHDRLAELLDLLSRMNCIIIDLDRNCWMYIANDVLIVKTVKGEVGSSTMPQKVNPIDFENSEGNAKVANSLLEGIGRELQTSRLQRDLSDTTMLRNVGVMFGHSLIAYLSTLQGLTKVSANKEKIAHELDNHYEILSEGIQTVLRRKGHEKPYEKLKELVRGKKVTATDISNFVKGLKLDSKTKESLSKLTTRDYSGAAVRLTELAIIKCRKELT